MMTLTLSVLFLNKLYSTNKIFSNYHPCQSVRSHQRIRDHLCPDHQENDVMMWGGGAKMIPETLVVLTN
jgi:hypothetical protein